MYARRPDASVLFQISCLTKKLDNETIKKQLKKTTEYMSFVWPLEAKTMQRFFGKIEDNVICDEA